VGYGYFRTFGIPDHKVEQFLTVFTQNLQFRSLNLIEINISFIIKVPNWLQTSWFFQGGWEKNIQVNLFQSVSVNTKFWGSCSLKKLSIDRSVIFIVLMEWYSIYSTVFFQCSKGKCLTLIKNDLYVKVKIQPMDMFTNNGLIMTNICPESATNYLLCSISVSSTKIFGIYGSRCISINR